MWGLDEDGLDLAVLLVPARLGLGLSLVVLWRWARDNAFAAGARTLAASPSTITIFVRLREGGRFGLVGLGLRALVLDLRLGHGLWLELSELPSFELLVSEEESS